MARYLMVHSFDPRIAKSEVQMQVIQPLLKSFTKNTYAITSWMAIGAGIVACLWEAPSEQSIIDVYPPDVDLPVEGIYPVTVIDWAEIKKTVAAEKKKAKAGKTRRKKSA